MKLLWDNDNWQTIEYKARERTKWDRFPKDKKHFEKAAERCLNAYRRKLERAKAVYQQQNVLYQFDASNPKPDEKLHQRIARYEWAMTALRQRLRPYT